MFFIGYEHFGFKKVKIGEFGVWIIEKVKPDRFRPGN